MKNKKLVVIMIGLLVTLTAVTTYLVVGKYFPSPDNVVKDPYYGSSTGGFCSSSSDCVVAGCNSEVCQSKNDPPTSSICLAPIDQKTPSQLGYECSCKSNKCVWSK